MKIDDIALKSNTLHAVFQRIASRKNLNCTYMRLGRLYPFSGLCVQALGKFLKRELNTQSEIGQTKLSGP